VTKRRTEYPRVPRAPRKYPKMTIEEIHERWPSTKEITVEMLTAGDVCFRLALWCERNQHLLAKQDSNLRASP
jgi:hypothetical protein